MAAPIISPTEQDFVKTAAGVPTTYAPGLTPYNATAPLDASISPSSINGTATGGGTNANQAYWGQQDQLVNDQLGRLGAQADVGKQNILDAYNSAFQTLTNQKAQGERDYNTARNNTIQDNILAKDNINAGVNRQLTGAERLLGARGAGNSSVASVLAPYAAGRAGNTQRADVQRTFGRNISSLDTGWQDALGNFGNAFGQLLTDRTNRERALQSQIDTTKTNLLGQKAAIAAYAGKAPDATIPGQINDLGHQIDQLGAVQSFTPAAVNATPASTQAYDYIKYNAPTAGSGIDPTLAAGVGPFWSLLNGKDKQKANPVGA